MNDLTFLPAVSMAEKIRKKEISPAELIDAHLTQIDKLNPKLNAFIHVDAERAREAARDATSTVLNKTALGSLHGVPLSIKSSLSVEGLRCEAGSRLHAGLVARRDAVLVTRLRKAGAIILGVTNTPELLMAWETDNLLYGRTNNPWDLERTPGGRRGGEAAAIAAGLSAAGVGSDGGGSIRVPAHFCGICGLKPTPGRIPSTGHYPKAGGPFALIGVVGPMARTVEDVRTLFEVMAGWDDVDPCAAPVEVRELDEKTVNAVPIGFFEDDERTPVTEETRSGGEHAAVTLMDYGFRVEPFRPEGLEKARVLWWEFFGRAGRMILEPMLRGHQSEVSPLLREFMEWSHAAETHTGETLLAAWLARDALREKILVQMRRYPVLICPVAAIPAFHHGEREWQVDGKAVQYLDAWSYCEWWNLLGFPAVVIPMGYSEQGLPIGVQIVGRPWEEEVVLAVAARLERECGPGRAPPVELSVR